MGWLPTASELGPHTENQSFSHTVQYLEEGTAADQLADPPVEGTPDVNYNVRIIPVEGVKTTITTTAGDPATVAGYYLKVFNDIIQYKDFSGNIVTVATDPTTSAWDKIDRTKVYEMTSFKADPVRVVTFHFIAEAYNPLSPNTVVATKNYTITVSDQNWTTGLLALEDLISYTRNR